MHISELPAVKLLFAAQNKEVLFKEKSTWGEDGSKSFLNWILTQTSCVSAITQWSSKVSADKHTQTDKQTCIVACPSDPQVLSLAAPLGLNTAPCSLSVASIPELGTRPLPFQHGREGLCVLRAAWEPPPKPSHAAGGLWEERQAGTGTGLAQGQHWQPASTACPRSCSCSWTASTQSSARARPQPGVPMAPQARHEVSEHCMAWWCLWQPFSCDPGVPSPRSRALRSMAVLLWKWFNSKGLRLLGSQCT